MLVCKTREFELNYVCCYIRQRNFRGNENFFLSRTVEFEEKKCNECFLIRVKLLEVAIMLNC